MLVGDRLEVLDHAEVPDRLPDVPFIGLVRAGVRPRSGLLDAAVCTVSAEAVDPRSVAVADVDAAASDLATRWEANPGAATTLAWLLHQTSHLPVVEAVAAESAAYSMLLAGPEFASWLLHRGKTEPGDDADPVLVTRDGDVLTVVLTRPARANAFSAAMRDSLVDALEVALRDPAVTVRLSGSGPHFCSGGDLSDFGTAPDPVTAHRVRMQQHVGLRVHELRERTVVELHGACSGAGIEIPAFAGNVCAATDTTIRLPELEMGLIPGAGGTVSITSRIGRWRMAWLALTGAPIDVGVAQAWGLIDAIG